MSNDHINYTYIRPNQLDSTILYEENETENKSSSNPSINPENRAGQMLSTQPPSIDFKLSVKIDISSGKCVLHADKLPNQSNVRSPFMNSPVSGGGFISPELMKNFVGTGNFSPNISSNYHDSDSRKTTFIFPAIGVQTFYESINKKILDKLTKKANLYAMIKLESFAMPTSIHGFNSRDLYMSRDMVLSPALLDFIEQTLEPFDLKSSINTPDGAKAKIHKSESLDEHSLKKKTIENNYFPVDVVVFVSMKPSAIRFTCMPQSTMECLLKLPSVEMVVSTSRIDSQTQTKLENILKSEKPEISDEFFLSNSLSASYNDGGLNLTCSLSDFSLKFYNRLAIRNTIDRFYYNDTHSAVFEEKDSLSVRVAYIKVNISRNKRIASKSNQTFAFNANSGQNEVKLSILADVGSTSFIYDMRNIKEVFVFPKIWYRRSFARRIIFGDEISTNNVPMGHESFPSSKNKDDLSVEETPNSKIIKRRNKNINI